MRPGEGDDSAHGDQQDDAGNRQKPMAIAWCKCAPLLVNQLLHVHPEQFASF
jgi:hypothetical protein